MRYVRVGDVWLPGEDEPAPSGPTGPRRRDGATGAGPCPECGGPGIPWVFGLPGPDLADAAARGEVILGGCIVPLDPRCPRCGGPMPDRPGAPDGWQGPADDTSSGEPAGGPGAGEGR